MFVVCFEVSNQEWLVGQYLIEIANVLVFDSCRLNVVRALESGGSESIVAV